MGSNHVLQHMRLFHAVPPYGYVCKFVNCGRTYDSLPNFRQHLNRFHQNPADVVQPPYQAQPDPRQDHQMISDDSDDGDGSDIGDDGGEGNLNGNPLNAVEEVTPESVVRNVSQSALVYVSKLYSIDTVNRTVVDEIVSMTSDFVSAIFSSVRTIIQVNDPEAEQVLDVASDLFAGLKTETQRFSALENSGYYFPPININIDYAQDVVNNHEPELLQVPLVGQFVSLKTVLKQFFELPMVLDKTLANYEELMSQEGVISNVVQGTLWKNFILPKFPGKVVLPINLYYDDFEPDNQLGSHQGDHKIGGTYYNCPVIPSQFLASLKNIFVAQLILSSDRDVVHGNHKVFHMLLEELKFLEEEGLLITVNNVSRRIYFALTLVLGDNLGLHSILGFPEGFTANYPCRMCQMHKDLVKRMTKIPPELLRTPENYAIDVLTNDQSLTGVYEQCVFNEVGSYHVIVNQSVDIMHDVLEGVAKYDMCQILKYLIYEREYFSLETLILRANDFFYSSIESGNKPPSENLTRERIFNESLNFSSAEMLCFVRYFGVMVGDLVPQNDLIWEFYLSLRKILDIIFAPSYVLGTEDNLKTLIETHHELYLECFRMQLRPKYHYMLHYFYLCLLLGPLLHLSSMRWESKHRELKQIAKATCCRKNLPLTLIKKYLLKLGFMFISGTGFKMNFELGLCLPEPRENVDPENIIDEFVNVDPAIRQFECVKWARLNGTYFRIGMVLHVDFSIDYPAFAVIDRILYLGLNHDFEPQIVFLCHRLVTTLFNPHYHAYEVTESAEWLAISYQDVLSTEPLMMRVLPQGGAYVSTRYLL